MQKLWPLAPWTRVADVRSEQRLSQRPAGLSETPLGEGAFERAGDCQGAFGVPYKPVASVWKAQCLPVSAPAGSSAVPDWNGGAQAK